MKMRMFKLRRHLGEKLVKMIKAPIENMAMGALIFRTE